MGAQLQRIEVLAGGARYAVTFRRDDGGEQTAVVELSGDTLEVAEANLPTGWTRSDAAFAATADAVRAVHRARDTGPAAPTLVDVDGGWDVGLGNVALSPAGVPICTAHGELTATGELYECPECGARARLTVPS